MLPKFGYRGGRETVDGDWAGPQHGRQGPPRDPSPPSQPVELCCSPPRPPFRRRRQSSVSSAAQPGSAKASLPEPSRAAATRCRATHPRPPRPLHHRTAGSNKNAPAHRLRTLEPPNCPSVCLLACLPASVFLSECWSVDRIQVRQHPSSCTMIAATSTDMRLGC
jgi:hypothetical protein